MERKGRAWRWGGQVFLGLLLSGFAAVLSMCWYLQYYKSAEYQQKALKQQLKIIPFSARRGMIADSQGRTLAVSVKKKSVRIDPSLIRDTRQAANQLGKVLSLDANQLFQALEARKDKRYLVVKRFVSDEEVERVLALKLRGVVIEPDYERQYPMGSLAAHVVGYTTDTGRGLEGIEAKYNKTLSGKPGQWVLSSDAIRRPVGAQGECVPAEDGKIVVLTLDAVIQSNVEKQLRETVAKFQAKGASGIVMDPMTGEILALANYPTFDLHAARQCSKEVKRNRALTDPVEPGSIFKPFTVASALEGGYVTVNQKIFCHNGYYSGKGIGVIKEYNNHGYGNLTVAEIIMRSSNIGTARVAQKMGKRYFHGMIDKFGFGKRTGIDLPGEGTGILRPLREWKWGQYALTRAAYGQGPIVVTPIQMIQGFCSIANGGKLVRPRVVRGVLNPDGTVARDIGMEAALTMVKAGDAYQVLKPQVSRKMVHEVLKAVVDRQGGTARRARIEGYEVFGKTGTAQMAVNGKYVDGKYVSSFIAGAPAWKPRICVLVMVREPDRSLGLGYTGGVVVAPAVKAIIEQTLPYLGVEKRLGEEEGSDTAVAVN
jgi:cell division protein FtsI/penicillin-binding protein 2